MQVTPYTRIQGRGGGGGGREVNTTTALRARHFCSLVLVIDSTMPSIVLSSLRECFVSISLSQVIANPCGYVIGLGASTAHGDGDSWGVAGLYGDRFFMKKRRGVIFFPWTTKTI